MVYWSSLAHAALPADLGSAWSYLPAVAVGLAAALAVRRLLERLTGRKMEGFPLFLSGSLALAVAVLSPLDWLGECCLLSMHMVQHELMRVVAPPLLLLGLRGFLPPLVGGAGRLLATLTRPAPATALMLVSAYLWHLPAFYEAALHWRPVHVGQHVLYLVTALLFWWGVLAPAPLAGHPSLTPQARLLQLLAAATGTLPVALVLLSAPAPLYPHYVQAALRPGWAWSPLADQQLAALIMMMSGGAVLATTLVVGLQWLNRQQGMARPGR